MQKGEVEYYSVIRHVFISVPLSFLFYGVFCLIKTDSGIGEGCFFLCFLSGREGSSHFHIVENRCFRACEVFLFLRLLFFFSFLTIKSAL